MATRRYSLFAFLILYSCVNHAEPNRLNIKNRIEGCFTITKWQLNTKHEPVTLRVSVGPEKKGSDCPCKSALFSYTVRQKEGSAYRNLLGGVFTTMNKSYVVLPVAIQKQLMADTTPIDISLTCSNPL